jgi:hypothetical protein
VAFRIGGWLARTLAGLVGGEFAFCSLEGGSCHTGITRLCWAGDIGAGTNAGDLTSGNSPLR